MFDSLSGKLQGILRGLRGRGRLSEEDVAAACREIRLALLEADVNFRVVRSFVSRVQEQAVGEDVIASLTPGQQVVKIVHEELTRLLGAEASDLELSARPSVVLMVGLQGGGKTTTASSRADSPPKENTLSSPPPTFAGRRRWSSFASSASR